MTEEAYEEINGQVRFSVDLLVSKSLLDGTDIDDIAGLIGSEAAKSMEAGVRKYIHENGGGSDPD